MTWFSFRALYRSLSYHLFYTFLNVGSLSIGIAAALVIGIYIRHETSFERWLPGHEEIYLIQTSWDQPGSPYDGIDSATMGGLLDLLKAEFPGITGTRIQYTQGAGTVLRGGIGLSENVSRVDAGFFDVFELPLIAGNAQDALAEPENVAISAGTAQKYFGDLSPLGQSMTITLYNQTRPYRVAAVFEDLPRTTDFQFSMLVRLPEKIHDPAWNFWGASNVLTFVRFPEADAAKAFALRLPDFVARRAQSDLGPDTPRLGLSLLPIDDLHLNPVGDEGGSPRSTVITLGLVGALILAIAIFNYVNLATARAGLRAREVAMRKVLGADRRALLIQFLAEAVAIALLSALAGLVLAIPMLQFLNAATGLLLSFPYLAILPATLALAILVGIASGFYPAIVLARLPAAGTLASAHTPGGGRTGARLREALVIFQFTIAVVLLTGTIVAAAQMRHMRNTDPGYDREQLLVVESFADPALDDSQRTRLVENVRKLPQVLAHTTADNAPGSGLDSADNFPVAGSNGNGVSMRRISIGPNFFQTYGTRLIAGRQFNDRFGADDSAGLDWSTPRNIIISRRALRAMGFVSPQAAIGKTIGGAAPRTIIGVAADMQFFSSRLTLGPTYYLYFSEMPPNPLLALRYNGAESDIAAVIAERWQQTAPQVPYQASTAEQRLRSYYDADTRTFKMLGVTSGLAIFIASIGLWGLASFTTARRMREIGIRKTLGATSGDITQLLVGQFLRPVIVSNLIAWPISYILLRQWLSGFADPIALSPTHFMASSVIIICVAILTISFQSSRASRTNIANILKND